MKRNEEVPCSTLRLPREGARGTGKRGRHPVWVLEKQKDEEKGNRRAGRQVLGRGSPQCFSAASRPIGVEAFYHAVILTVQTSYCKKWHRECPEKRRTPAHRKMGRRFPQGCLRGCRWSTAKPSPAGTPARRSAVEAALAGFRDIRTGSSNVAAVFTRRPGRGRRVSFLAAFFQRRIVSATFNRQEWLWIPTKRPSKARRASIAC